ncbi:MAG: hypothetical protein H0V56_03055 [Chthoniobacterales bacterium]|nr:hypothetical protein [Chthoniobacterales bacterium]
MLTLALRRAYAVSWPGAIARGAVVYLTYLIASMIFMYGLLAVAIRFSGRGGTLGEFFGQQLRRGRGV